MKSEQRNQAFNKYLVRGPKAFDAVELRALQADSGEAGGFLIKLEMEYFKAQR